MTIDVEESQVLEKNAADVSATVADNNDNDNDTDASLGNSEDTHFDVNYSCLKCGTITSGTEISRLPEIKCICGYKVFTKVRPPVVKTIHAL